MAVLILAPIGIAASDMISEPVAVLQGLDKITARVSDIEAPVGKTVRFGSLSITVRDCEKNPPEDKPESAAFLQIDEVRPGEDNRQAFQRMDVRAEPGAVVARKPSLRRDPARL